MSEQYPWESRVRTVLQPVYAKRGWMLWAIWAMLGAVLTLQGNLTQTTLVTAVLLTSPFWILFAVWPFFWLWRLYLDRALATLTIEPVVLDYAHEAPVQMPVIVLRTTVAVAEPELAAYCHEQSMPVPRWPVVPAGTYPGVAVEVVLLEDLVAWAQRRTTDETAAVRRLADWVMLAQRRYAL